MPFPLSHKGAVLSELPGVPATMDVLEEAIRDQRARTVQREGDTIRFKGSFMSRRWGGSVLTVISWGTLRVVQIESQIRVEYDLHFFQNLLVRGAVAAAAFGFIFFGIKTADPLQTVVAGVGFWLLLVSLDYMLAASIFPRFLRGKLLKD